MSDSDLLRHLQSLEVELHQPLARSDVNRLDELLHDAFFEFGKSGASATKADILELLPAESGPSSIWSEGYELFKLAENVVLLTYKSAYTDKSGRLFKHTLRSSIWVKTARGWQVRFHQGTPTSVFREHAT